MNIPVECNRWRELMAMGNDDQREVLGNIETERCLNETVSREFFAALQARGTPDTSLEAWQIAKDVVRENLDQLAMQLHVIPEDLFINVLRVDSLSALQFRFPALYEEETRSIYGFNDQNAELHGLPLELLNDILLRYKGTLSIGNRIGISWVTDWGVVEQLEPIDVIDRLGLCDLLEEDSCFYFVFGRAAMGATLHVPSVLDAIDRPGFQPTNPGARMGQTRACSENLEGLPEAVHKSSMIEEYGFQIREI